MKQVRTVRGRNIDMDALAKENENIRAVSPGNVKMNAKGDRVDNSGNVIQTVKAKSKQQHDTTSVVETRKLSDAPSASPRKAKKKDNAAPDPLMHTIVRQEEKERDDGSKYVEIEYNDGSIDVKELDQ